MGLGTLARIAAVMVALLLPGLALAQTTGAGIATSPSDTTGIVMPPAGTAAPALGNRATGLPPVTTGNTPLTTKNNDAGTTDTSTTPPK